MYSAISATPIADRCVKSSTHPCNLQKQTLAVEWAVLKSSVTFNVAPSQDATFPTSQFRQIYAQLELPWSTSSVVIVKWKRLRSTTAQPRSGKPHKLTERDHRVLKCVVQKNRLSSVATLTTKFQTDSGSNVSTSTVRELLEIGFHGRAAVHKPKITMHNAKRWLEWCKAHRHWTGAVETRSLE